MTDPVDLVRLRVGDTNMADPLLSDDEIETFVVGRTVGTAVNVAYAASDAAKAIAAKFARAYSFATEGQSFNRSERVAHYMNLAMELRVEGRAAAGSGVSVPVRSSIAAAIEGTLTLGE